MSQTTHKYDLEERTARFGEEIILFAKELPQDVVTQTIVRQLVRSGTSIGANYMEANGASSRKDFRNKIHICKKEAQESKHWLRMSLKCWPEKEDVIKLLQQECQELVMIFQKICSSLR